MRQKRLLRFSIESGHNKTQKGQWKHKLIWHSTQGDQRFRFPQEQDFALSFSNYRDWSLYGDAQAICRLHTVLFWYFRGPAHFIDLFILSNTTFIDMLSVVWLQMKQKKKKKKKKKTVLISVKVAVVFLFTVIKNINRHNKTIEAVGQYYLPRVDKSSCYPHTRAIIV